MTPPGHVSQREVFALFQDPATHGLGTPVTRIDTHGAAVFLAGPDVYKVKRAVRFPFLDFSTLEKRHAACLAEIEVNRLNAPGLYLGVVPVTRRAGALHLGGDGPAVEWAVHLRRFDENATLDRLAAQGALGPDVSDALAEAVAAAHRRAAPGDGAAATRHLYDVVTETAGELACEPEVFPPHAAAALGQALGVAFSDAEPLLLRRGAQGQVRHCHGDLHLGNVAMIGGAPVLFDAIEFNEALATTDIFYDLAFLLMDLCKRGLVADANRVLNRYLRRVHPSFDDELSGIEGLAALPLFMGLRAAIRAKVTAALLHLDPLRPQVQDDALDYLAAAARFLAPAPPVLIAVGGLSGTGKTTLAAALAPVLGRAPGALHLRSDVERKRLFGVSEIARLPDDAYRPEVSSQVQARLHALAAAALGAGQAVVLDATHRQPAERAAAEAVAAQAGVPFTGLWLDAPARTVAQRIAGRHGDASDATAAIAAAQAAQVIGAVGWQRLDATQSTGCLERSARLHLQPVCTTLGKPVAGTPIIDPCQ